MPSRRFKRVGQTASRVGGALCLAALGGCSIKQAHQADLINGKKVFVQKCGSCHTLARAGSKGTVGPNLDDAFRNSLANGLQRNTVKGAVHAQILNPEIGGVMPAKLVDGKAATDVAAYVAYATGRGGPDTGLLASAVPSAGAGKPAVEAGGVLQVDADPNGQLAYVTNKATGKPGSVTVRMVNTSGTPHNIAVQQGTNGPLLGASPITAKGTSSVKVALKAGTYTFFCQVPGHRQAGMLGTLTVS